MSKKRKMKHVDTDDVDKQKEEVDTEDIYDDEQRERLNFSLSLSDFLTTTPILISSQHTHNNHNNTTQHKTSLKQTDLNKDTKKKERIKRRPHLQAL